MKRQNAFVEKNKMLKGALHCHTTRSDGEGEPADVIRLHKKNGYDFMAITDHRIYNYKNYAEDVEMTIIPAMELDNTFEHENGFRTYHTVCIGPDDESNPIKQDEKFPRGEYADQKGFQKILDDMHKKNNLTIYCHPEWSGTPTRYYDELQGNFAMEICNTSCEGTCEMDHDNGFKWDELLGRGVKLFAVASDDGHGMYEHCKGWVMVNAENNVKSILEALKNGAFYATKGPEIKDFYVDDEGVAHVEASDVKCICFCADKHPSEITRAEEGGTITSAELNVRNDYTYVRAYVIDENGNKAWTNPIYLDE